METVFKKKPQIISYAINNLSDIEESSTELLIDDGGSVGSESTTSFKLLVKPNELRKE